MGYNTTVVVLNDALSDIQTDPDFGRKLAEACLSAIHRKKVDVPAGGCVNAATVIETHHANEFVTVRVGGNTGEVVVGERLQERVEELECALREIGELHLQSVNTYRRGKDIAASMFDKAHDIVRRTGADRYKMKNTHEER